MGSGLILKGVPRAKPSAYDRGQDYCSLVPSASRSAVCFSLLSPNLQSCCPFLSPLQWYGFSTNYCWSSIYLTWLVSIVRIWHFKHNSKQAINSCSSSHTPRLSIFQCHSNCNNLLPLSFAYCQGRWSQGLDTQCLSTSRACWVALIRYLWGVAAELALLSSKWQDIAALACLEVSWWTS